MVLKLIYLKLIPGTIYHYASDNGKIYRKHSNKFVKLKTRNNLKYKTVSFKVNGKTKTGTVHGFVARAWIPNPLKKPTVNHIDRNTHHNKVSNLEWATRAEQNKHVKENGGTHNFTRPVVQISKTGELIAKFNS